MTTGIRFPTFPHPAVVLQILVGTALYLGLPMWGWGSVGGFLENPARMGICGVVLCSTLATLGSGMNRRDGKQEKGFRTWHSAIILAVLLGHAWFPAYADRRDLWTVPGDAVRYGGLGVGLLGAVLRVGPMFALGHRFTGIVIQVDHRLVTNGFYRYIRNPHYTGEILSALGWVLVFRCWVGVIVPVLLVALIVARMRLEEATLRREFGDEFDAYARRTWRLAPFLY